VPQDGVRADRVGQHLIDGEGGANRRQDEDVRVAPEPPDPRSQFAEPVLGGEHIRRGVTAPALQDGSDHRQHRVRVPGEEIAELCESLGDPRSGVQQGARVQERTERHVDGTAEIPFHPRSRHQVRLPHRAVAEELQFGDIGEPDAEVVNVAGIPSADPAVGVVVIDLGDEVEHPGQVGHGSGQQADAVQRAAGRHESDGADQPP
jgi:hypothetical protein